VEPGNHLRVTALRREYRTSPDPFDLSFLECQVEVQALGMRASCLASLRSDDFEKLRDDLAELDSRFVPGAVTFETGYEKALWFTITVPPTGRNRVSGLVIDGYGSPAEQRLSFEFAVPDSLRSILASAESVVREFPSPPDSSVPMSRPSRKHA
jgi:hypothetical protein